MESKLSSRDSLVFCKGALLLRPLTFDDLDAVHRWLSDPEILSLTFVVPGPQYKPLLPFSHNASKQYLNILIHDKRRFSFAIVFNGSHVGNVGIKDYQSDKNSAECFIEIGESSCRGIGVGTEAMKLLLNFGMKKLLLKAVRLEVLEFNAPAIRLYKRLGFEDTHRTGWHYDNQGRYWQVLGMSLSSERWLSDYNQATNL
jgi:RimJ/RimL family protein N-acetyltransferase